MITNRYCPNCIEPLKKDKLPIGIMGGKKPVFKCSVCGYHETEDSHYLESKNIDRFNEHRDIVNNSLNNYYKENGLKVYPENDGPFKNYSIGNKITP